MIQQPKQLKSFKCSTCGADILPPPFADVIFSATVVGKFKATLEYFCQNCGKRYLTNYQGEIKINCKKIENALS